MFLKWEERLLNFCRILLSCQAGFLSLWRHQLSWPVGFCHSSSTCLKPPFLARQDICRHGDIWSWKTWVLELHSRHGDILLLGRHLARQDFVAIATGFGQTGQRTCNSRRQEMLCLAGMTVADQNLQVAPLFVFLSLVHVLSLFSCTIGLSKT